ncbi:MAG: hypothetical protein AAGD14_03070 [Planctomycetota bacterium]
MRNENWVVVVLAGLLLLAGGLFLAAESWRAGSMQETQSELRRAAATRQEAASRATRTNGITQLPFLEARIDNERVILTLGNDTTDRTIEITTEMHRILVEYNVGSADEHVRAVRVKPMVLRPGETREVDTVPLGGPVDAMRVSFEWREPMNRTSVRGRIVRSQDDE